MSDQLLDRIDACRSRLRRVYLLAGICRTLLALIGLIAAFFLLDYLVISRSIDAGALDVAIRAVLVLGLVGAVGAVFVRTVVRELRTERSDDEIALRVERSHPQLRGRLISTVQLTREDPEHDSLVSQEMIDCLAEETVSFSEALDFGSFINTRTLSRLAAGALAVLAIAVGLSWWRQDYARALAERLLLTHAAYPTAARILRVTPSHSVGRGDDVPIEVVLDAHRALPDACTAQLRGEDGRTTELALTRVDGAPAGEALYRGVITRTVDDLSFRAFALDARWPTWEHITVLQRPALKALELVAHFPSYLGQPDETSSIGDIRAPTGTTVAIRCHLTKPVLRATFTQRLLVHLPDGRPGESTSTEAMTLSEGGSLAETRLQVLENGSWSIDLEDADGFRNVEPIAFTLSAIPDRPPTVSIRSPTQDKDVGRFARWPIVWLARDDHAVAHAWLKWIIQTPSADGQLEGEDAAKALAAAEASAQGMPIDIPAHQAQVGGTVPLEIAKTGAAEGQRVTFWIEVADNCEPEAHHARSSRYSFTVLSQQALKEKLEKERAELMKQIRVLREKEEASHTTIQAVQSAVP